MALKHEGEKKHRDKPDHKHREHHQSFGPVGIMDTTMRDGHQSLLATRMRFDDMEPLIAMLDSAGFAALEVWGGATFDATTRFLNEDPWKRLAEFKRRTKTPLQMLLRGQNLVGYRHYADDVVDAFVQKSADTGIDIFRVFDALNDERNMERSFTAIRKTGKHIQATLCYTLTEPMLGGPIYNIDYYVDKARVMARMGAQSLCVKDMAGILCPQDAFVLIRALKEAVDLPIQLHTHYTSGMGAMTYLKAIEAGVDIVDCALAPLALRTSQPAVEPLLMALKGTDRDPGIDLQLLARAGELIEKIAPKYRDLLDTSRLAQIDAGVLIHQIPGGMLSNLVNQLREADALDRIDEVYKELPRTRADMGYPPLVTPSSQIVGTQAVMNVLFGRYKQVTKETKDYMAGLYGRSPAPMDAAVQQVVLAGHKYQEQITVRPADLLDPEMDKAREAVKDITTDLGDVLIYALYPTTGMKFLRWKFGLEAPPKEVQPKAAPTAPAPAPAKSAPTRSAAAKKFNVYVDGEYFEVEVDPAGMVTGCAPAAPSAPSPAAPAASAPTPAAAGPGALLAPMPGILIEYRVKAGDTVKAGDVLLVLEAMKMQNELKADRAGTVKGLNHQPGDRVHKGESLLVIA